MKRILMMVLVCVSASLFAQSTCETAQPFCAGGVSGVTFPATTGTTTGQPGPYYGCLGSTPNPAWYYLQIGNSGSLDILIQGMATSPPGPGQDVDFICWGPFNSLAGICNSLTIGNVVDCSYSASFTETLNITAGVTGQYYLVLITNFANVPQNIIFSQFGGTGNTNCSLIATNFTLCAGNSVSITTTPPTGLTNISYSLQPGNLTSTTPTFVVSPTVTTNYSIYATGFNTLNVALTQSATSNVTVFGSPQVAPTTTNSTCTNSLSSFNLGLTFYPSNATSGYTVNWASAPNGVLNGSQTSGTGNYSPGPYTATVITNEGCRTVANFSISPQPIPATFSFSPAGPGYTINCYQPTITISAMNSANNYTWMNGSSAPMYTGDGTMTIGGTGTWTVYAINPISGCTSSRTISVGANTVLPVSSVSPTFQNITCSLTSIVPVTLTAISPSINCVTYVYTSLGGTFVSNSQVTNYVPSGPGTNTMILMNSANGCSVVKTFTVSSNQGFPTFSVSCAQNFTLGCASKSAAVINIDNGTSTNSLQIPTGGAVSYTVLPPNASTVTPPGILGSITHYTITTPGTYTVITKDNSSFCETRLPVSIITNTVPPSLDTLIVPSTILDCNTTSVVLQGVSSTNSVSFNWSYDTNTGNLASYSIAVKANFTVAPTNTLIDTYTLTIRDENNMCKTTTVVTMYQNLFPPKAVISNGGISAISCKTGTIMLTNTSSSNIPPNSIFTTGAPVIGQTWLGPSPQDPQNFASTYVAGIPGTYTMIAKDLGNGCITKTVIAISDDRNYPVVNLPNEPPPFILDCGSPSVGIYPNVAEPKTNLSYVWQLPAVVGVSGATSPTLLTGSTGIYKVLVTNTLNGCASVGNLSVVNGTLGADFEPDNYSGFVPLEVTFKNLSASSTTVGNVASVWNFGNSTASVTASASVSPKVEFKAPGNYTVTLYASKGECMSKATRVITVELPSALEIPNVFTPNGDNVNDFFFLKSAGLKKISIRIYDRWGAVVYELETEKGNISWDGKNRFGKEVADGVYMYIITATGSDGKEFDKKGTVSLFR
mgnify:CR=1 FL=1